MKKLLTAAALTAILLNFSSCASLFTGTKDVVIVNSVPSGAEVEVNGVRMGQTPLNMRVKKGFNGKMVVVKKEGYKDKHFYTDNSFNAISLLNFFVPFGFIVDIATGAMMRVDPKNYEVVLDKEN